MSFFHEGLPLSTLQHYAPLHWVVDGVFRLNLDGNWRDGLLVTQLTTAAYLSKKKGRRIRFNPEDFKGYRPKVALGEWKPRSIIIEAG